MKHSEQWLLGAVLAAGGMLSLAQLAPAGDPGISVYTWTDAQGTTHFSDAPRKDGPAQPVAYVPIFPPHRRHFRRGHGHRRYHGSWSVSTSPIASFPQNSLPSSFPPGLPNSFPGYLPSSFPEMQNSRFSPSPPR